MLEQILPGLRFHLIVALPITKLPSKPTFFPSVPSPLQVWVRAVHFVQATFFHGLQNVSPLPLQGTRTDSTHLASQHHTDVYHSLYQIPLLYAFGILQTKKVKLHCLISIFLTSETR